MAEFPALVINTGPLIALAAATGDWAILRVLPWRWMTPRRVIDELAAGRPGSPGKNLIERSPWIQVLPDPEPTPPYLRAALDAGEAAVIALAMAQSIQDVAIDEQAGRSIARTCGLRVTGSMGILLAAKRAGSPINISECIDRISAAGIWLSPALIRQVLSLSNHPTPPT